MLKTFFKTYLISNAGFSKYYFIGIGALVIILVVAAAAIFLSPDLQKNLNISTGNKLEKSRVAGQIVDINYDEDYFVIDDEDSGEEFLINLPEGTVITSPSPNGDRTYKLGDLDLGQYIELKNVKYTSGGGGNPGNSNNNPGGGGPGDPNIVDPNDWEDIDIYFPYPAFSATILSIDNENKSVEVETTTTGGKIFTILVDDESLILPLGGTGSKNRLEFSDLSVGQRLDIFSETDPTSSSILDTAALIVYQ